MQRMLLSKANLKNTMKWVGGAVSFFLIGYTAWLAIAVSLSYFEWSPLGYEPCGLQAMGWWLFIYPALGVNILIRATVKHYYRLSWHYLLPPVVFCIIYLPVALYSGDLKLAVSSTIIIVLTVIIILITDIFSLRGKRINHAETGDN